MRLDGPDRVFEEASAQLSPKICSMRGTIVAVSISYKEGIPKSRSIGGARLAEHGFRDDYHNSAMRRSFSKPGTFKPNIDRHISVVSFEVVKDLNKELDLKLQAGSLGENITTKGLGDLSQIKDGSVLKIGDKIQLRVTEQNQPCVNLAPLHRLLPKKIMGRRGLLCAIEAGVGEWVLPGQEIEVIEP